MLKLHSESYEVIIENAPLYAPNSADNARIYDVEYRLGNQLYLPSSQHSVMVENGEQVFHSCVLLAGGGGTGIHTGSALLHENLCLLAVGAFMCALSLPDLKLQWQTEVDDATCFGVYFSERHNCFFSHGELLIARVDLNGQLIWQSGGKDIFTGSFELHPDHIEAEDFNGERYRIDVESGASLVMDSP